MVNPEEILKNSRYEYALIVHDKPLPTAKAGAEYFGIEIAQTAPALIIDTYPGFALFIASGGNKVDLDLLAGTLGCKKASLASRREVETVTGYQAGEVPLIGLGLPCVVDKRLFKYNFIYGGSGRAGVTLKINPYALLELNKVIALLQEI